MKKNQLLAMALCTVCVSHLAAVEHGSVAGQAVNLYVQHNGNFNPNATPLTQKLDFKVVTIGSKTWAWTHQIGGAVGAAGWASQFRTYAPAKVEHNLTIRSDENSESSGIIGQAIPEVSKISFFQAPNDADFYETALYDYDVAKKNSADPNDKIPPVTGECKTTFVGSSTAILSLSATDNSNFFFYYLRNRADNMETVSFAPTITLDGLKAMTGYEIEVTPIDFSGNEGQTKTVSFKTQDIINITSGIAKDIRFVLKSTSEELEYYYEMVNPENTFRDAFLKYTVGGVTQEVKPSISPDGKYCYGVLNSNRIWDETLELNMGYFIYVAGEPNWGDYVIENTKITEGELAGTPIVCRMGQGPAMETVVPELESASLSDVTTKYVQLTLKGSDNSGVIYYEIAGAEGKANLFRTGTAYLSNILPEKLYNLRVVAKDLAGNASEDTLYVQVQTSMLRSDIGDNKRMNYNSLTLPSGQGGELQSIIKREDNKLTIGVTTRNQSLADNKVNVRFFPSDSLNQTPTVTIDEVVYPLTDRIPSESTSDKGITTAQITFTDKIGEVDIEDNAVFKIRWDVTWWMGGRFFTADFTYRIGDNGQDDTRGPSKPELITEEHDSSAETVVMVWFPCIDNLSGVKGYEVIVDNEEPQLIFNLGQEQFRLSIHKDASLRVTAVDYAGNRSDTASHNYSKIDSHEIDPAQIYVSLDGNVLTLHGVDARKMLVYSVGGSLVAEAIHVNQVDISALNKGIYLIRAYDGVGKAYVVKMVK